jgi:quercetin dioxygenase-like cupin family protein
MTAPDTLDWLGTTYSTILSSATTGGRMSIVDSTSPGGSGPPRHVHADADETFVVLTGRCEFWVAGKTFARGPGETAYIPRGVEHTFRVSGDGESRHILILTPGGFEGFFVEMAREGYRIPENMGEIVEVAARYHLTFTGPPIGA